VNEQVFALLPPLEHAPDHTASRPFETLSVIDVPVVNDADPVLPTVTLMPAGVDVTRSPLLPVARTVSATAAPGGGAACGFTVSEAVRVTPPTAAVIVTVVDAVTAVVVTVKFAVDAPAGTVTLTGTAAAPELSLSETVTPPVAAAALKVTVPPEEAPPMTLVGFNDSAESVAPVDPDGLIVSVALFVTFS
jgi:hypothetical protein